MGDVIDFQQAVRLAERKKDNREELELLARFVREKEETAAVMGDAIGILDDMAQDFLAEEGMKYSNFRLAGRSADGYARNILTPYETERLTLEYRWTSKGGTIYSCVVSAGYGDVYEYTYGDAETVPVEMSLYKAGDDGHVYFKGKDGWEYMGEGSDWLPLREREYGGNGMESWDGPDDWDELDEDVRLAMADSEINGALFNYFADSMDERFTEFLKEQWNGTRNLFAEIGEHSECVVLRTGNRGDEETFYYPGDYMCFITPGMCRYGYLAATENGTYKMYQYITPGDVLTDNEYDEAAINDDDYYLKEVFATDDINGFARFFAKLSSYKQGGREDFAVPISEDAFLFGENLDVVYKGRKKPENKITEEEKKEREEIKEKIEEIKSRVLGRNRKTNPGFGRYPT